MLPNIHFDSPLCVELMASSPPVQVTKLNDVRDDNATYNNRLDTTLADVFSLLSLFYLTIGKTRDTPATYCQIASMRVGTLPTYPNGHIHQGHSEALMPLIPWAPQTLD